MIPVADLNRAAVRAVAYARSLTGQVEQAAGATARWGKRRRPI